MNTIKLLDPPSDKRMQEGSCVYCGTPFFRRGHAPWCREVQAKFGGGQ